LGIAPILKIDRQHVGNFDFLNVPFFAPWPVFGGDVLSEPCFRSCNFARRRVWMVPSERRGGT
jgi:hypothetical protein